MEVDYHLHFVQMPLHLMHDVRFTLATAFDQLTDLQQLGAELFL